MIRDILKYFDAGVAGITKTSKQFFECVIAIAKTLSTQVEKAGSTLFGKQSDDLTSVIRLLRQMVEVSKPFANFVIPFHYSQAIEVLNSMKGIKNVKFQAELVQTIGSWNELKSSYDSMNKEDH